MSERVTVVRPPTQRVAVLRPSPERRTIVATQGMRGPAGPPGGGGGGHSFVHEQVMPAATWVIEHGLNKKPSVTLVIDGQQVWSAVSYPSQSQVTVTWPMPTAGEAHLV